MNDFSEILGHDKIKEHLQNAIKLNKVSHAYIFNGESGAGKKSLAKVFSKTLQCEAKGDNPCNECHSCKQAESGNQPDIIWVSHEKPTSIGVEDIREQVIGDIQIKPYSSKYKIYIIDEAEKLTLQAQNALLKTIEEPPAYGIIILLTTNADTFLQTILSRCVQLDLKPVRDEVIQNYLIKNYQVPDYQARFAVAFAQGRIGRAVSIVNSKDFMEMKEHALHVLKYSNEMTVSELIDAVKYVNNYKNNINDYIDLMAMWFRDVLIFKSTNDANLLIFKDELTRIKKQAEKSSYEGLEDIIDSMDKAKLRLKANVNFDLTLELMFLTMKDNL
ncbi:DNA polymerase III subunit delta' [[Clostridium] fimetarium]|uniref:DNA polymerase III subunit delta' n=1 Tax=[Clostridium] fimetarium TaxID=99656 RepID=A0A1I0RVX2_9FIRM|nr:DNA polymerase III subunit delta' [[Clostridium] fimetarium]SEW45631.1 DNA polymerase-3 subunit delta' [[Clostridium] fimetarium]